jgi:hypothetical protein
VVCVFSAFLSCVYFQKDWQADNKGRDAMSQGTFHHALFELVDHWTEGHTMEGAYICASCLSWNNRAHDVVALSPEYVELLDAMLPKITVLQRHAGAKSQVMTSRKYKPLPLVFVALLRDKIKRDVMKKLREAQAELERESASPKGRAKGKSFHSKKKAHVSCVFLWHVDTVAPFLVFLGVFGGGLFWGVVTHAPSSICGPHLRVLVNL